MNKKCFSLTDCSLKHNCEHAQTHDNHATGWFQPQNTGDHCSFYKPREVETDLHHRISMLAGCHE